MISGKKIDRPDYDPEALFERRKDRLRFVLREDMHKIFLGGALSPCSGERPWRAVAAGRRADRRVLAAGLAMEHQLARAGLAVPEGSLPHRRRLRPLPVLLRRRAG